MATTSSKQEYGVFTWTVENRYPRVNAVRIYKSRAAADKFCDANVGKNYVSRLIFY